jgi:hypothetical protein
MEFILSAYELPSASGLQNLMNIKPTGGGKYVDGAKMSRLYTQGQRRRPVSEMFLKQR